MRLYDKVRSISKKWAVDAKCCFKHDAAPMAYKVNCTVKTHKPRNKVCIRLLHSASGHSMRGLSAIANKLFSETLGKIPFLAKNTSDVIRSVSAKRFHHVHFLKLDIDSFYMSGDHDTIAKKCADGVDQCHKKVIVEVIMYLLFYQFVVHRDAHGAYRIYQVKRHRHGC